MAHGHMADMGMEESGMVKTAGVNQLLTILALIVAPVGVFLTYNGVEDLRVVLATVLSIAWLSVSMLIYYRKLTMQRLRAQESSPAAEPRES